MPGALDELEALLRAIGERLEESLQLAYSSAAAVTEAEAGAHQAGAQGLVEQLQNLRDVVARVGTATDAAKDTVQEALYLTAIVKT